jgi:hypothetical protein
VPKTLASETQTGNWLTEARCTGPDHHKVFLNQMDPDGAYKCPFCRHDI